MPRAFEIQGQAGFIRRVLGRINLFQQYGATRLREATTFFVEELMAHTPVWSGRTVSSITVSNTGITRNKITIPAGDFGSTNPLPRLPHPSPPEKMRASAQAEARATIDRTRFTLSDPVYVTVSSPAWPLIEKNAAPSAARARTKGYSIVTVVQDAMRNRYPFLR